MAGVTSSGRPLLVVQHEPHAGPGRLTAELGPLHVVRPDLGEPLPEDAGAAGYGGLVVLGGTYGAWDDHIWPWLADTRGLLARAVGTGLPTLGICLGAQLLAAATGGRVEVGGPGPEIGLVEVELADDAAADPFFGAVRAGLGARLSVPQFHLDAVTALPPDGELLVSGQRYPHQGFRVGSAAWGVQYHPEVTAEDFAAWVREESPALKAAGLTPQEALDPYLAAAPALAESARRHALAFRAVVDAG